MIPARKSKVIFPLDKSSVQSDKCGQETIVGRLVLKGLACGDCCDFTD